MDDQAGLLDQADEEILTFSISDEQIEAAAGTPKAAMSAPALDGTVPFTMAPSGLCGC